MEQLKKAEQEKLDMIKQQEDEILRQVEEKSKKKFDKKEFDKKIELQVKQYQNGIEKRLAEKKKNDV